MGDNDDPGEGVIAWGSLSIASSIPTPSQDHSISCKTCLSLFVPIDFR
jgi:hypothetical protein